jgi:hypothetical protein
LAALALGALLPLAPASGLAAQDPCPIRFLRFDEPEAQLVRLRAVREGRGVVGMRTPASVDQDCPGEHGARAGLDLRAGVLVRNGELRSVAGQPPDASRRVRDYTGAGVRAHGWAPLGPAALVAGGSVDGRRSSLDELYAALSWGPAVPWLGRRAAGHGPGEGGGLVLSGTVPLDGVGIALARPTRLPGFLSGLGTLTGETLVARLGDNGEIGHPWLWSTHVVLAPGEGFSVGVNRGIMLGGDGAPALTFSRFLTGVLVGNHVKEDGRNVDVANQIVSVELAARIAPGGVPTLLFVEWGAEDSSGAWWDSPGVVAGVQVALRERDVRLGLEGTWLSGENGHGFWYRHTLYGAGWSSDGRLLGHPLAGPGREWLAHASVHDGAGAWDVALGLRLRDRYRGNTWTPALAGRSWGGFAHARLRRGGVDLFLDADAERADRSGADSGRVEVGVRLARGRVR